MITPAVSVIIPVFNRAALVLEAIRSALATSVPIEVILVDDCSTDDTWAVIQSCSLPIRAIRLPRNSGQSSARNAGIEVASGDYLKFLDSDDVLVEGHLGRELAAARAMDADIVMSGWGECFPDGKTRIFEAPDLVEPVTDSLLAGCAVPTSAALYRRRKNWRWDPSLRLRDDWDFFCQAALGAQKIVKIDGTAYWLRAHAGQRVTTTTMILNAHAHHAVLHKIEARLAREGLLSEDRKRRLAQYYYKELRVLCLGDREAFEAALRHIDALDPAFVPRDEEGQWWMRFSARILGARRAILAHSAVKRMVRGA